MFDFQGFMQFANNPMQYMINRGIPQNIASNPQKILILQKVSFFILAKKIILGALIFLLSATVFTAASAKKVAGIWRLDGSASAEPRNL